MPVIQPYFSPTYQPGTPVFVTFYQSLLEQRQAAKMMQMEMLLREADTEYLDKQIKISNENIRELLGIKADILAAKEKGENEFGWKLIEIHLQEETKRMAINATRQGNNLDFFSKQLNNKEGQLTDFREAEERRGQAVAGLGLNEHKIKIAGALSAFPVASGTERKHNDQIAWINEQMLPIAKETGNFGDSPPKLQERHMYLGIAEYAESQRTRKSGDPWVQIKSAAQRKALGTVGNQHLGRTLPEVASLVDVEQTLRDNYVVEGGASHELMALLSSGGVPGARVGGISTTVNVPEIAKEIIAADYPALAKKLGLPSVAEQETSAAITDLESQIGQERLKLGSLEQRRMGEAEKTADRYKQAEKVMQRSLFSPSYEAPAAGQAFLDQLATIAPPPKPVAEPEGPQKSKTYQNLELGKMYLPDRNNPNIGVGMDAEDNPIFSMHGQLYAPTTAQETNSLTMILQGMNESIQETLDRAAAEAQ